MMNVEFAVSDVATLDSPALLIYPERVKHNIDLAVRMVGDVRRLRPHVKTNKSAEATKLMLDAGISRFKCATIAEAEMLGMTGAADVLLAYQPLGPRLQRFISLIRKYPRTRYACLTDCLPAAQEQAVAFATQRLDVAVFVDLNIGQNRTGIVPDNAAFQLFSACVALKGLHPAGLHAYDGHIRSADFALRTKACDEAFGKVEALKNKIVEAGFPEPLIVAGGSPTFPIHAKRGGVECSPGTFIYWDKGYGDLCPEQGFQPAALLLTRVISLPDATTLCLDLGHKSVAAENPLSHRVFFLNAPELKPVSQSEEHLVVEAGAGHGYRVGDVLYGLPFHICPTVALYERAFTIENGLISGEWRMVARDRKITC